MRQALVAEGLGTALLLAVVVGSGIMGERLAAGNVALALLANSLATGAGLYVLITLFAPVSGAHFNPAVSLLMTLRGVLPWRRLPAYALVQCLGGVLGVWLAHAMFAQPLWQLSSQMRVGPSLWLAEAVATAGLLLTILGAQRQAPTQLPALVGAYIAAAYWFTASTSFANPAVTLARSLTDSFAGIHPAGLPGFIAAQLLAVLLLWKTADPLLKPSP
jgi:glycerol uptake facilitator-like aquaporin